MMGTPWTEQQLGCPLLDILNLVRAELRADNFDRAHWDHKSDFYVPGRSNKQIKIAGAILAGRTDITYDEAWHAIRTAILGPSGA